jgi:penicillin-binding protein 1A
MTKTFTLIVAGLFCVVCFFLNHIERLANPYVLRDYHPTQLNRFYDKNNQFFTQCGKKKRIVVPYAHIPPILIYSFIMAEDRHFFHHFGIDMVSILRALIQNTLKNNWSKRPIGASTITQQLVKNALVGKKQSLQRKVEEALVALRLEQKFSKEKILHIYLNDLYLGGGYYGVCAASYGYFGCSLKRLTIAQCATLAALAKHPSLALRTNAQHKRKMFLRRNWIIHQLEMNGYITQKQKEDAQKEPLILPHYNPIDIKNYYIEVAQKQIKEQFGSHVDGEGGAKVYTFLDPALQDLAMASLQKGLMRYDEANGVFDGVVAHQPINPNLSHHVQTNEDVRFLHQYLSPFMDKTVECIWIVDQKHCFFKALTKKNDVIIVDSKKQPWNNLHILREGDVVFAQKRKNHWTLVQVPKITGAIVVMEPNGVVRSLCGGFHPNLSHFNCATQAMRQIGSTVKPWIYYLALAHGYHVNSIIDNGPISIFLSNKQKKYQPKNYDPAVKGYDLLWKGLVFSKNCMTVRLAQKIGFSTLGRILKVYNLVDKIKDHPSIALGAISTTLLRLTTAYAMFFGGGKKIKPTFFQKIQPSKGDVLWSLDGNEELDDQHGSKTSALSQVHHMMHNVVELGTAKILKPLQHQHHLYIAGKTGSTNQWKDALFVGYMKDLEPIARWYHELVIGIFVGYPIPKSLGRQGTGGKLAVPIMYDLMDAMFKQKSLSHPLHHRHKKTITLMVKGVKA